MNSNKYRPDIDGLRAIAIAPVVLYHANCPFFSGGFVGVDIFFVISGYLITRIIVDELERNNSFSFMEFYERRIRRILPALIVMMAVTAIVSVFLLLYLELKDFGKSVIAASLFGANFYFWKSISYFSPAKDTLPLLHTWSLAVEEQFYIFYPLFLIFVRRWSLKAIVPLIAIGAIISFASSIYMMNLRPQYAFYLAPFRAWEIALGALISLEAFPPVANRAACTGLAALGLGMIVFSILAYSSKTEFPGISALLPCMGAALLIYTGNCGPSPIRTLLSARLPVALGLISYPLYLWHWPLFVFARYVTLHDLSTEENALLVTVSVGLAFLSWRYLETPFRSKAAFRNRPRLFAAATISVSVLVACGAIFEWSDGLPCRLPSEVVALEKAGHDHNFDDLRCHDMMEGDIRADRLCRVGDASVPGTWMVWGDSDAWALRPAIETWMQGNIESGWISSRGGCPPLLGIVRRAWERCKEPNAATLDFITRHKISKVLLVAAWSGYTTIDFKDEASNGYSPEETRRVLSRAVELTFASLFERGVKIYVFESVPGAKERVPLHLSPGEVFSSVPSGN